MNNPNHISENLETIFWIKYLNSLMRIRDLGWEKFGSGIREKHPGYAKLLYIMVYDFAQILREYR
jgi:hypothetical protein